MNSNKYELILLGATQLAEAMVNFYPCVIFWKMSDFNGKMLKVWTKLSKFLR